MGYRLEPDHNSYLHIILEGRLDKATALAAMNDLMIHPEYPVKNTLWDFDKVQMGLNLQDIGEIVGILRLYKPVNKKFANRVAFLVKNQMELAMANVFIAGTALLPFKYKAFTDLNKARRFLALENN